MFKILIFMMKVLTKGGNTVMGWSPVNSYHCAHQEPAGVAGTPHDNL